MGARKKTNETYLPLAWIRPLAAYLSSGYEEKIQKIRGMAANLGGYQ